MMVQTSKGKGKIMVQIGKGKGKWNVLRPMFRQQKAKGNAKVKSSTCSLKPVGGVAKVGTLIFIAVIMVTRRGTIQNT